ncbi:hypothetical protein ACP70R_009680 [Stipagrostis hirtigluma subsp. patula]
MSCTPPICRELRPSATSSTPPRASQLQPELHAAASSATSGPTCWLP